MYKRGDLIIWYGKVGVFDGYFALKTKCIVKVDGRNYCQPAMTKDIELHPVQKLEIYKVLTEL
jgi:hypothetical protein